MPVKNHDGPALSARQALQPAKQVDFLRDVQLLTEAAGLMEGGRLAKDERTGSPLVDPAEQIPQRNAEPDRKPIRFEADGTAAGQAAARLNFFGDLGEQAIARPGVGVDEHQPVPGCARRAGIARPADLIDRLEHHLGTRGARDLRRPVGRVVVADDQLNMPSRAAP